MEGVNIESTGVVRETDPPETTAPPRKKAARERQKGWEGVRPGTFAGAPDTTIARSGEEQFGPVSIT